MASLIAAAERGGGRRQRLLVHITSDHRKSCAFCGHDIETGADLKARAFLQHPGGVSKFGKKLIAGMVANGYEPEFAEKGFGSYGFPESHAASFALIAYASSWLKCWHPDVFCAAPQRAADGLLRTRTDRP